LIDIRENSAFCFLNRQSLRHLVRLSIAIAEQTGGLNYLRMLRKTARRELVNGLSKPRYTQLNVVRDWEKDPAYHKIVPPALGKWKLPAIPENIKLPHYAVKSGSSPWDDIIPLAVPVGPPEFYDEHLAPGMRKAGRIAAECLQYATSLVKPGVTTREIDKKVTEWAFEHNCYPSSLNYGGSDYEGGFPGSLCTSVNNVLSHGVPNEYCP